MSRKLFYLYCVTSPGTENCILIPGIGGNSIYCIEYNNLKVWLSIADEINIKCSLENLKIHNQISLSLMEKHTVIPFQYGTVVNSENDIYSIMNKLYLDLIENINNLTDKYEIGIKVFGKIKTDDISGLDELTAVRRISEIKNKMDCREYLVDRIKAYEEEKLKEQKCNEIKNILLKDLIILSEDYKILKGSKNKMLLNSAFLIKRSNTKAFEERFDSIEMNNPDYSFLFSGPWPPYNFIKITKKVSANGTNL